MQAREAEFPESLDPCVPSRFWLRCTHHGAAKSARYAFHTAKTRAMAFRQRGMRIHRPSLRQEFGHDIPRVNKHSEQLLGWLYISPLSRLPTLRALRALACLLAAVAANSSAAG